MKKIIVTGISLVFFIGIASQASAKKIHCWDLNENYACDIETEDMNSDGKCNARDCKTVEPCYAILQTGQTLCYDTVGNIIECAGTGQDGELQKGVARSYTDNGDGTIMDNTTGLMWERLCDNDVNPLCPVINDVDPTYTWDGAYQKIADLNTTPCFANYCDWRLPNYNELQTLVHYGKQVLAIDSVFDNDVDSFTFGDPGSATYWTSTSRQNDPSQKWVIGFVEGRNWLMENNYLANVRAVRGPE